MNWYVNAMEYNLYLSLIALRTLQGHRLIRV